MIMGWVLISLHTSRVFNLHTYTPAMDLNIKSHSFPYAQVNWSQCSSALDMTKHRHRVDGKTWMFKINVLQWLCYHRFSQINLTWTWTLTLTISFFIFHLLLNYLQLPNLFIFWHIDRLTLTHDTPIPLFYFWTFHCYDTFVHTWDKYTWDCFSQVFILFFINSYKTIGCGNNHVTPRLKHNNPCGCAESMQEEKSRRPAENLIRDKWVNTCHSHALVQKIHLWCVIKRSLYYITIYLIHAL